jgi:hypothetical protein
MDFNNYLEIYKRNEQKKLNISFLKLHTIKSIIKDEFGIYYSTLSKNELKEKVKNKQYYEYICDLKDEFNIIELTNDEEKIIDGSIKKDLIDCLEVDYGMFNEMSM